MSCEIIGGRVDWAGCVMVSDTGVKMHMRVWSARLYVQWEKMSSAERLGDIVKCVLIKPISRKAVLFPHIEKFHGNPASQSNLIPARREGWPVKS